MGNLLTNYEFHIELLAAENDLKLVESKFWKKSREEKISRITCKLMLVKLQ